MVSIMVRVTCKAQTTEGTGTFSDWGEWSEVTTKALISIQLDSKQTKQTQLVGTHSDTRTDQGSIRSVPHQSNRRVAAVGWMCSFRTPSWQTSCSSPDSSHRKLQQGLLLHYGPLVAPLRTLTIASSSLRAKKPRAFGCHRSSLHLWNSRKMLEAIWSPASESYCPGP